jgi:acetylornithine deacetylase/succinyl-diaminopimelate desuccinylase-like protein
MNQNKILKDLISIDSQVSKSNGEIISYIESQLKDYDYQRQQYSQGENLIVNIEGKSREDPIVIAGHTDTIDVSGNWRTNPLKPLQNDRKIFGLGACDMKGSLAGLIYAIKTVSLFRRDLYLVFDGSEEDNSQGAKEAVRLLPNIKNALVMIPEPSNGRFYLSQNGYFDFYACGKHIERKLKPSDDAEKERTSAIKQFGKAEIKDGYWNPPYKCPKRGRISRLVNSVDSNILEANEPFSGWTEAPLFSRYGPAFIFGAGDYRNAHKPNEFIDLRDLERFTTFIQRMITYK